MATSVAQARHEAAERRRRVFAYLDAADGNPTRGRAVRACEMAKSFCRADGDMKAARVYLRGAVQCVGEQYGTIYRGWIAMEVDHDGTNVDVARALFEEWRALGGHRDGGFWCHYVNFELQHCHGGGAHRARAVAEAAVVSCTGDPAVYAKYTKVEMRLGHKDHALAVLDRGLVAVGEDAGAQDWLVDEVHREFRNSLRRQSLAVRIRSCCSGLRLRRPHHGYERLGQSV